MVYIYPSTITTTTGRSTKYGTQQISNKAALCSNSTTLAYWGTKKPLFVGNYMRNYPDSVTTPSGSYFKPETIYATGWEIKDIPNDAIVQTIVVEYKWEQIAYSSLTSFGKFDKPTISIIHKNKTLTSIKGAKPEAIRYNNNKVNKSKMNTNYAELATLHSHKIDLSKYNLTIKDLKKIKIKFNPAKNQASNHCRIVMQFLRLKVTYKKENKPIIEPVTVKQNPIYRIKSSITPKEATQNSEWTYECIIKGQNSTQKPTTCSLSFTNDIDVTKIIVDKGSTYNHTTKTWTINSFTNRSSKLILKCKSHILSEKQTHSITAKINKYADSVENKTTAYVNIIADRIYLDARIIGATKPYTFRSIGETIQKAMQIDLSLDKLNATGTITIATDNWLNDPNDMFIDGIGATIRYNGDGKWKVENITTQTLTILSNAKEIKPGTYNIIVTYEEIIDQSTNKKRQVIDKFNIDVIGNTLDKEFFKLRLEDGSDVRYNSLMFAPGDDLTVPLTYDIIQDTDLRKHLIITGEEKSIPVNEARYIGFDIELKDTEETYNNIFAYIDVVDNEGQNCSDIIMAADGNVQLFQGEENKFCVINELKPNEKQRINFVVQSEIEQICDIKLKPFNYDDYETEDNRWTISRAYFKDIPNLKLSIEANKYDLNVDNNAEVIVTYTIENKSTNTFQVPQNDITNVTGYKFKLIEPSSFKIKSFSIDGGTDKDYYLSYEDMEDSYAPQFNPKNRIITLPRIQGATYNTSNGELTTTPYTLIVHYVATEKGIYDFKMCTEDNPSFIDDDQYKKCVKKQVLVNIDSNIKVKTFVSKQRPYIGELIDFTIQMTNYTKPQATLTFDIQDIGAYEMDHPQCDYQVEGVNCSDSIFTESNDGNKIGVWTINDVPINSTYELVLTLRPLDTGYHTIKTILTNNDIMVQDFTNFVNVLEVNKKLSFDVYHAVKGEGDCSNCNQLIEICDEDYVNIGDDLYYVMSVTNNSKNPILEATHIYARLPEKLLDISCYTNGYGFHQDDTGLISFTIPSLEPCENKKVCIKANTANKGTYITNFMLTNHNAHTYHKQLKIHVNDEFDAHKLEHEIIIYNFEKTNRYFRYELDGDNNIYKFFNQGNRPTKYVEAEDYKQSNIERYRGKNLKDLLEKIATNSKYIDPELLRIGNNKLKDKGYELYPDGFIRRFGLLNSEIFHYAGQFPTITSTVDHAMRWDQDCWDNKFWGGGIYENGVFDLSIDYSKVPTNFDILNINNPIGKLQALVDKVKPYGTQAICHYNDTIDINLKTDLNVNNSETNVVVPYQLYLPNNGFDLISLYNRHDNSIAVYYDMLYYTLGTNIDTNTSLTSNDKDIMSMNPDVFSYVDVYDEAFYRRYIHESLDIVQNMYDINTYNNIDIVKEFKYNGEEYNDISINLTKNMQYTFEYQYDDNQQVNINIDNEKYVISYVADIMNEFKGFVVYKNDEPIFKRNIGNDIQQYHIQIETYQMSDFIETDENVIHFWIHTDDAKYYHLGYVIIGSLQNVILYGQGANSYELINHNTRGTNDLVNTDPITFTISNNIYNTNITPKTIKQPSDKYQWQRMYKFFEPKGYVLFENNAEIDPDCHDSYRSSPTLALKYDNININDYDEVTNIDIRMKAISNKANFIDDLNINMYKDSHYYIPDNDIGSKTYYPNKITNVYEEYVSRINIQQPNITICSDCLKTSLGHYDKCPYCDSEHTTHYHDKKAVTVCYNCGYIIDGWHDYCTHCLSDDIEKTQVDYNKTYCNECGALENDYYSRCPQCFSRDVVHLNNDEYKYIIQSDAMQNIDSIVVQSDIDRINICNITLPFNMDTAAIKQYEYLQLHIYGMNHNDGKFYYCKSCGHVGLGNVDRCEECGVINVENYSFDNVTMDIYVQENNTYRRIDTDTAYDQLKGEFDIAIDIKDLANKNTSANEFKLLLYVENLLYDQIKYTINKLDIEDKDYQYLVNNIQKMNISIDNIYYESKYVDTIEWKDVDQLEGINHSAITYDANNTKETDYISFSNFDLDQERYESLSLCIDGINRSHSNIIMHLLVLDKNENILYNSEKDGNISINPDLFEYKSDLTDLVEYNQLTAISKIKIAFKNITEPTDIAITGCNIIGTFKKYYNTLDLNVDPSKYEIIQDNNTYLIKSNNLFGLKNVKPKYVDGKQLENGLVCFLDFDKFNANEYIRLYNVELLITYKNKYGQLITETIDNTDNKYTELLVQGNVIKDKGSNWTSIKTSTNILYNLEYEIINNGKEDNLSAIPLQTKLAQSFMLTQNNLGSITLSYFGQIGNPNESITVQLYDDYENRPDNLICTKNIKLPTTNDDITIDLNIDNLDLERYWIVLIDSSADEYNYHRFRYNGNLDIGSLIHNDDEYDQNRVLCIGIDANVTMYESYLIPMYLEDDINMTFKVSEQLYRYNVQGSNTTSIDNLSVKLGYRQYNIDETPTTDDEEEEYTEDDDYGIND